MRPFVGVVDEISIWSRGWLDEEVGALAKKVKGREMIMHTNRRTMMKLAGATSLYRAVPSLAKNPLAKGPVPHHLKEFSSLYAQDPMAAATQWFRDAKYGLFLHYGVYSLMEVGEWALYKKKVPLEEYSKLADQFTAEKFDADRITDVALEAGMKYITFTSRHHDSFCMFDTKYSDFKSTNSPCKRDFVGELVEQCNQKGLGFFPYYSYGRDWRHPHAPESDKLKAFREQGLILPEKADEPYDMKIYEEFVNNQVSELLTNYGDIAGIWFDAPPEIINNLDVFTPQNTYDMIHGLQPHAMVSAKWGISGTEDFYAPEFHQFFGFYTNTMDRDIPMEICDNLGSGWGWSAQYKNRGIEHLEKSLASAAFWDANLLINSGPRPDGSLFEGDVKVLREMGQRIKSQGFPAPKNYTERMHASQRDRLLAKCLELRKSRRSTR